MDRRCVLYYGRDCCHSDRALNDYLDRELVNTPSSEPGLQHWRWQRGSALVLTPFGLWFIFQMLLLPDFEYQTVISWLATMFNSFAMTVLLIALLVHSLLGLQVVIEDYIANPLQRTLIRITRFIGIAILAATITSIFTI